MNVPTIIWTRLLSTTVREGIFSASASSDGSIYVTGYTDGNLDGYNNYGDGDVFIAKYSSAGTKLWTRLLGSSSFDYGNDLAVSNDGFVYVTGQTYGNLGNQLSNGQTDAFIAKYDSLGNRVWVKLLGSTSYDSGVAITVGLDNSIYVTGYTGGDFDDNRRIGSDDVFITKFDPSGNKIWSKIFGTSFWEDPYDIATSKDGSIYMVGSTEGRTTTQANFGARDALVTKYDQNGKLIWIKLIGSASADSANSIVVGSDGSIYIAGETTGNIDGIVNPSLQKTPSDGRQIFLTHLSSDGSKLWTQYLGVSTPNWSPSITIGADDLIYLTGQTDGSFDNQVNAGKTDSFLSCFTSKGEKLWTKFIGSTESDYANSVITSPDGTVFIGGETYGNLNGLASSNKAGDGFIIKLQSSSLADTVPPTIALSSSASSLSGSQTATINFVLSEASTNFTASDVIVVGGTLSNFTGSGSAYTAVFTLTANSNINGSVTVPSNVFTDSAGNSNADGSEANNSLYFTRSQTVINETHTLSVIVDKDVLSASATLLKELKESITYTNGSITKHSVEYAGLTFDYNQIDSLITTVTRDGEFTSEFTKEINDFLGTELNITYSSAVKLVGAANIDGVILSIAGADGNFVS